MNKLIPKQEYFTRLKDLNILESTINPNSLSIVTEQ